VGQRTVAGRLYSRGVGPDEFVEVPAIDWLYDANLHEEAAILEWSRALPFYNSVLTLLYIESTVEARRDADDDDECGSELDPGEFGLGRRRWPGRRS
jgi:hypothetical protein